MGNTLQIVDSIASSPTVLLDLNDEVNYGVADIDLTPPPLRYTSSSSMLADGERISASAYANRTVGITFDHIAATQAALATSWQTLARLIDQERFWLKYQPVGGSPVFFNCYRADVPSLEDIRGAVAYEVPALRIPAAPAAYGLVESGSVSVNNDPVAGTNPCFWRIGTGVKGDLETPLFISTNSAADASTRTVLAASSSLRFGLSQTAPYIVQLPPAAGWTTTGAWTTGSGDAAMSGGNYYRFTSAGAGAQTGTVTANAGTLVMTGNPIGDYRVFIRYRSNAPADDWTLQLVQYDATAGRVFGEVLTVGGGNAAGWMDLGVFRWPIGAPTVDTAFGTTPASAGTRIEIRLTLPAGSVAGDRLDLDTLMFVPVGVDQAAVNHLALVSPPSITASTAYVLDGPNDRAYLQNSTGTLGTSGIPAYVGSMPTVVPGCDNSLTWLRTVTGALSGATDDVTASTTLNWQYWPRYLRIRPAST